MSLLNAHQTLLAAGRPRGDDFTLTPPAEALQQLVEFADHHGRLDASQPWELAPWICRQLEDESPRTPAGGWSKLAGLAAGAGILHATADGFVPVATTSWIRNEPDGFRRRMVEAFTARLIPPAAAAALYVALDVHPMWGLELGRDVGATDAPPRGITAGATSALPVVKELVFGTLTGLLTALRCAEPDMRYPVDALGDVLWSSAVAARRLANADAVKHAGLPVFLDGTVDQRRQLTTRLAISDLLDFVFVPAGVARRDDSGWFAADGDALIDVRIGDWELERQIGWWNDALRLAHRDAC